MEQRQLRPLVCRKTMEFICFLGTHLLGCGRCGNASLHSSIFLGVSVTFREIFAPYSLSYQHLTAVICLLHPASGCTAASTACGWTHSLDNFCGSLKCSAAKLTITLIVKYVTRFQSQHSCKWMYQVHASHILWVVKTRTGLLDQNQNRLLDQFIWPCVCHEPLHFCSANSILSLITSIACVWINLFSRMASSLDLKILGERGRQSDIFFSSMWTILTNNNFLLISDLNLSCFSFHWFFMCFLLPKNPLVPFSKKLLYMLLPTSAFLLINKQIVVLKLLLYFIQCSNNFCGSSLHPVQFVNVAFKVYSWDVHAAVHFFFTYWFNGSDLLIYQCFQSWTPAWMTGLIVNRA